MAIEYSDAESAWNEKLLSLLTKTVRGDSGEADSSEEVSELKISTPESDKIIETGSADEPRNGETGEATGYVSDRAMGQQRILVVSLVLGVLVLLAMGLYVLYLSKQIDDMAQQMALLETQQSKQDDSAVLSGLTQRIVGLEETQQQMTQALTGTAGQAELQAAIKEIELQLMELKTRPAEAAPAAAEKKVESPKPAPKDNGWVIHLATLSDPNVADKIITKAKTLGLDVRKSQVTVNDKQMYRLSIEGLSSRQHAEKLASKVQQQLALTRKPWIAKQ